MQIIVALGNPGKQYEKTRHNAGWLFIDEFYKEKKDELNFGEWSENKKFCAMICEGHENGGKIILAKPTTFMNESGRAVAALINFYKSDPADLTVIHDEIDLPLGAFKIQNDISSAGHRGVQSIIDAIGTQNFTRVRIGIGKDDRTKQGETTKFVLNKFSIFDRAKLRKIFKEIITALP